MCADRIWLSSPHIGTAEREFVNDAFETNWIAPLGPHVSAFETELCAVTGSGHAAVLNSGTSSIHLALVLLEVGPGDVVLCQSFTFSATANPILYLGATPVFIDSEPSTWNMCPESLEDALRKFSSQGVRPKAILPVHLYGMPARMLEIVEIAHRYGVPVIEDAAEALGSTYRQQPCGSFGLMSVLSFNGNKIITTSAGGALLSEDQLLIERARFLATQARDPAPHYQHSSIGYNYRMSNVLAAIGRGQLKVLPDRVAARRANFNRYDAFFESVPGIELLHEPDSTFFSNRWLTTIIVDVSDRPGVDRERIRLTLLEDSIEARPVWKPLHMQPVFSGYPYFGKGVSEGIFKGGLCLPSGSNLTDSDFDRIFAVLDVLLR